MVEVAGVEPASETASRNELHRLVYEVDVATCLETVGGRCHRPCQQVPSLLVIPSSRPFTPLGSATDVMDGLPKQPSLDLALRLWVAGEIYERTNTSRPAR